LVCSSRLVRKSNLGGTAGVMKTPVLQAFSTTKQRELSCDATALDRWPVTSTVRAPAG
jgi:hypothetical protein